MLTEDPAMYYFHFNGTQYGKLHPWRKRDKRRLMKRELRKLKAAIRNKD